MWSQIPRPTIFAHRGASYYAPENTLAAFDLAVRQGADGIELDAKLTADRHVVVIHDQTLERTTAHRGRVKDTTLAEIRRLDAGSHFDFAFRGEPIPTLDEVFASFGHRTFINIELTNYASMADALPEKVAELVKHYNLEQRVLLSSFNPFALIRARRLLPGVPIGLLAMQGWRGSWARGWLGHWLSYQSLHPELSDVNPRLVEDIHRWGTRLYVYTVNRSQDMRRLFKMKVDGIYTDDPVLARQALSIVNH